MKLIQIAEKLLINLYDKHLQSASGNWMLDGIAEEMQCEVGQADMAARLLRDQGLIHYSGGVPAGAARIDPHGVVAVEEGKFDGDGSAVEEGLRKALGERLDPIAEQLAYLQNSVDHIGRVLYDRLPPGLGEGLEELQAKLAVIDQNAKTAAEAASEIGALFQAEQTKTLLQKLSKGAGTKLAHAALAKLVFTAAQVIAAGVV